ncbi:putative tyrosinase [Seiridium cardinale]
MQEKLRQEYASLEKVNGTVEIPNPLFAYKFQSNTDAQFKFRNLSTATRYDSRTQFSAEISKRVQNKLFTERLPPFTREVNQELAVEGNLRERVVYLIQAYEKFDHVTHNQWDPARVPATGRDGRPSKVQGLGFGSIEDIHNTLHVLVGGSGDYGGHMGSVPISAFDPIFWLHHTNIDRLVSIWQGLHDDETKPDSWVSTKPARGGTWVTPPDADEGLTTPLAPFYKVANNFWDSTAVRKTTTFGYGYPETQSWNFKETADCRKDIRNHLTTLYTAGSLGNMIAASQRGGTTLDHINRALEAISQKTTSQKPESSLTSVLPPSDVPKVQVSDDRSLTKLAKDDTYLEWLVNIKAQKYPLNGKYLVRVFLGPVPQDDSTILYSVSPYHVGTFWPLGQPEDTQCDKCQRDQAARTEITGQIPLDFASAERYFADALGSLSEDDGITYLQKNLHWEVVDNQGQRLQSRRSDVDGLLVGVVSNRVKLPATEHDLPRYSPDITIYPEITTKQDGCSGRAKSTGITEDSKYFS